jgi:hypothetical protein
MESRVNNNTAVIESIQKSQCHKASIRGSRMVERGPRSDEERDKQDRRDAKGEPPLGGLGDKLERINRGPRFEAASQSLFIRSLPALQWHIYWTGLDTRQELIRRREHVLSRWAPEQSGLTSYSSMFLFV